MRPWRLLRESFKLRDGRSVVLRPIDKADAPRLIDLHNHLSFEAQYYRFFGPKPNLSEAEAEYLANVDFHSRFAVVAEIGKGKDVSIVGVGRFDVNKPGVAEAAIVIRDDFQHVGLGTAILERMREIARGAGIRAFSAEILAENTPMLQLLETNDVRIEPSGDGVVRVEVPLALPMLVKGLHFYEHFADALRQRFPAV